MKSKTVLVFFLATSLVSSASHAGFGIPAEAIEAADRGVQPAYIPVIMEEFQRQLSEFVSRKKIQSPQQKLALLLTLSSICVTASDYAWDAATIPHLVIDGVFTLHEPFSRACLLLNNAAESAAGWSSDTRAVDYHKAATEAWDTWITEPMNDPVDSVLDASTLAAEEAVGAGLTPQQVGFRAYRVAEQVALQHTFLKATEILEVFYPVALTAISENADLEMNQLATRSRWVSFRRNFFEWQQVEMPPGVSVFLQPWILNIFDPLFPLWSLRTHFLFPPEDQAAARTVWSAHYLGRNNQRPNLLGTLPADLVREFIIPLVMRANEENRLDRASSLLSDQSSEEEASPMSKRPKISVD